MKPKPKLTKRQTAVLDCIALGLGDKQAAVQLGMSVWTVRAHLREIYRRLNAKGRLSAAMMWEKANRRHR